MGAYDLTKTSVLVTGTAGFIGYHLAKLLLENGVSVVGVDGFTDYYDVTLKEDREAALQNFENYESYRVRVENREKIMEIFEKHRPEYVIHLAAQAGVRYSIDAPAEYVDGNLVGTFSILEAARAYTPKHLLLASTSSVYGANTKMPYQETDKCDTQVSFYAATKKANEAMGHSYADLFKIPTTMFRFFTVYGPWGRPDMAPYKFTKAILEDRTIDVYNHGDMLRDFTYVTDLVEGIRLLMDAVPEVGKPAGDFDSLSPIAPYRIVNIGNGQPVKLGDFIAAIEKATGKVAEKNFMPMQPGDVKATWADTSLLQALTNYAPKTDIVDGMQSFVDWYKAYYG